MWQEVASYIGPKEGDPFAGLRSFYRLLKAARDVLKRHGPAPGTKWMGEVLSLGACMWAMNIPTKPGDLRPAKCEAVDFNLGTRWDQPWERSSRRFQ
eukprot:symbB.v1.2.039663.t1/scaffold6709.1/size16065/3